MGPLAPGVVGAWLVERDGELGEIDRALTGAVAGEGWLVLLKGPAGIGKTALLDVARDRAGRAGVAVAGARGAELERGFTYGVVRQLLEATVRATDAPGRERLLAGAAALAMPAVLGSDATSGDPMDQTFAVLHGSVLAGREPRDGGAGRAVGRRCPLGGRAVVAVSGLSGAAGWRAWRRR